MNKISFGIGVIVITLISSSFLSPIHVALAQPARSTEQQGVISQPVNINQADLEGFQMVKGIGPVLAERIVSYREANGKFKSLEGLKEVKGIGEAKFEKIKSQLTL